jgi:hypothetical protein
MAEDTKEKKSKIKTIYTFLVDREEEVEQTETKKVKNKETGKMEDVKETRVIKESIPYRVIIRQPGRREMEEADMEYSIEMSKCIKNGILTKAMLAKQYSDTGGLMTEEDAKFLDRQYGQLADLQNKFTKLSTKQKRTKVDEDKISQITEDLASTRKVIIDLETNYSSLFNHTADSKAQNKAIMWYLVNLVSIKKDEDEDEMLEPLFKGETFDEKRDYYYDLEEEGEDEIFNLVNNKLTTLLSFWYFSTSATKEDFERLENDIEEGNV